MRHDEFSVGVEFNMSGKRYRCTDVGARVIIAIHLEEDKNQSWFKGPPYAVEEMVIDELDMDSCERII